MSTKTVTTLTQEERQQLSVDLLTQTPVTKQNYYSLYITNPQVNCICKIWNRIVYCLFSWLGWFLGEASDVNRKVSMNQETALIQNYNQAKKTLLEALNKEKAEPCPEAEANYLTALNARVEQIHTFGYSTQAIQRGCKLENDDLLKVATADLQKALKEGILLPASLQSTSQQDIQRNTQSTSLQTDPTPPPQEDPVKKVLNFKPEKAKASSAFTFTSQPSSSSASSSSSTSTSTTSSPVLPADTQPVEKEPEFTLQEITNARNALAEEFLAKKNVKDISETLIKAFVKAAERHRASQPDVSFTEYRAVLERLTKKVIEESLRQNKDAPNDNAMLRLNIRLAKEWGICTKTYLSDAISLMINNVLTKDFIFDPFRIVSGVHPSDLTPYETFYLTIKDLSAYVKASDDFNCDDFIRGKLRELLMQVNSKLPARYIEFFKQRNMKETEAPKQLVTGIAIFVHLSHQKHKTDEEDPSALLDRILGAIIARATKTSAKSEG